MSDSQFIRNKDPHQVSMPEGSRIASSKSADVGGPIQQNIHIDKEFIISEEIDPLLNLTFKLPEMVKNSTEFNLKFKDDISIVKKFEEVEKIQIQPEFTSEYIEAEIKLLARLTNLKIENDKVKNELVKLDKLMSSGI